MRELTKEQLIIKAISNIVRRLNYYYLCDELDLNFITENEFLEEINKNPDKYVIKIDRAATFNERDIIKKIYQENKVVFNDYSLDDIENDFFGFK